MVIALFQYFQNKSSLEFILLAIPIVIGVLIIGNSIIVVIQIISVCNAISLKTAKPSFWQQQ